MGKGTIIVYKDLFLYIEEVITLEDWHRVLLLPENYHVLDLKMEGPSFNSHDDRFVLTVESDEIYPVPGPVLPTVVLHHALQDGKPCLDRIWVDYREVLRTSGILD